ncbi:uncharacterized protein LOC113350771 [Papaver somniferum]|uniref:uncharacterized protein LOC113350771 n=1 Tax=Papaver somniferum TaxID=3469 RepID=UPI000E6FA4FE|nr:uncharacterized protein LOC113350771 [Papaver somniferum]
MFVHRYHEEGLTLILRLAIFVFIVGVITTSSSGVNALNSSAKLDKSNEVTASVKLDENTVVPGNEKQPNTDVGDVKCVPCQQNILPPPPPPPKATTKTYCPPPPFYYITGQPGNLYEFDPYYAGAAGDRVRLSILLVIGCWLIGMFGY